MNFAEKFNLQNPDPGMLAVAWVGQAGFLIKNCRGKVMALDVYLSDLAEKMDGNKRLIPSLCAPEELTVDLVLATHKHADHLDMDSIPVWINQGAHLYCCSESKALCLKAGLREESITAMKKGVMKEDGGYRIEAVFADHGDTAPSAVGFIIESDGIRIYFTGDTSYQYERMKYAAEKEIQLLLLPINGEYGNMNERDAAMLAAQVKAAVTVPCHFWTFARHRGNPYDFLLAMRELAPDCNGYLMAQGEIIKITREGMS